MKADGYGHGAVRSARAALEAGADRLGVALVEEGVELREAGIDAPILVLSEPVPGRGRDGRRAPAHAGRVHRRRDRRAREGGRRPRRARTARACTSRSTPACTASAAAPTTRSSSRAQVVDRPELRARGRVHALRGRRRARQPLHRPSSSHASTRCSPTLPRARPADRHRARVQHRGRDRRGPARATTWCASASASTASRRAARSRAAVELAPGAGGEGARLAREDRCRPATRCRTGCATRPPRDDADRDGADRLRRRRAARAAAARRRGADRAGGGARSRARSRWTS